MAVMRRLCNGSISENVEGLKLYKFAKFHAFMNKWMIQHFFFLLLLLFSVYMYDQSTLRHHCSWIVVYKQSYVLLVYKYIELMDAFN